MTTIKVPETGTVKGMDGLCLIHADRSSADFRINPMTVCDRRKGHRGPHTWELLLRIASLEQQLAAARPLSKDPHISRGFGGT